MKNLARMLTVLALTALVAVPLFAASAQNSNTTDDFFGVNVVGDELELTTQDVRVTAAKIINAAMSLLGLVAVVIILAGGFKWMTAGGSEDKVEEAKKLIGAGVIGLVIIISAYSIARFVISSLESATS
ncbi:MAG: pilin [Patescibacteria group bacterium]